MRTILKTLLLLSVLFQNNLFSKNCSVKIWLKSGASLCFNQVEIGHSGLINSGIIKIYYKTIDSLVTQDENIVKDLVKKHKELSYDFSFGAYTVKGFEEVHYNAINIGLELLGKSLTGGPFINFVYQGKHSFEFGLGKGETNIFMHESISAEVYYLNYSFLYGHKRIKLELGAGIAFGNALFYDYEIFADTPDTTGSFSGLIIPTTIAFRYQREVNGIVFKLGMTPVFFTKPIGVRIVMILAVGYTFGL